MALTQDLFGITRSIPQTKERNWGAQVTAILSDLCYGVDTIMTLQSNQGILALTPDTSALAAGATLTVTHPWHRVSGSGGAVTLDGTTAISDGAKDGQMLRLTGTDGTNTVTIPDAANTELNGVITLGLGDQIDLIWDDTRSLWCEASRNN